MLRNPPAEGAGPQPVSVLQLLGMLTRGAGDPQHPSIPRALEQDSSKHSTKRLWKILLRDGEFQARWQSTRLLPCEELPTASTSPGHAQLLGAQTPGGTMDAAATSVNSTATGKGDRGALCIKMRKVPPAPPPGTAQGPWGHRETNVCDSTLSGRQAAGAPRGGRVMASSPSETLIEQKLIEINTLQDISAQ